MLSIHPIQKVNGGILEAKPSYVTTALDYETAERLLGLKGHRRFPRLGRPPGTKCGSLDFFLFPFLRPLCALRKCLEIRSVLTVTLQIGQISIELASFPNLVVAGAFTSILAEAERMLLGAFGKDEGSQHWCTFAMCFSNLVILSLALQAGQSRYSLVKVDELSLDSKASPKSKFIGEVPSVDAPETSRDCCNCIGLACSGTEEVGKLIL
jgi:hypothetical protein